MYSVEFKPPGNPWVDEDWDLDMTFKVHLDRKESHFELCTSEVEQNHCPLSARCLKTDDERRLATTRGQNKRGAEGQPSTSAPSSNRRKTNGPQRSAPVTAFPPGKEDNCRLFFRPDTFAVCYLPLRGVVNANIVADNSGGHLWDIHAYGQLVTDLFSFTTNGKETATMKLYHDAVVKLCRRRTSVDTSTIDSGHFRTLLSVNAGAWQSPKCKALEALWPVDATSPAGVADPPPSSAWCAGGAQTNGMCTVVKCGDNVKTPSKQPSSGNWKGSSGPATDNTYHLEHVFPKGLIGRGKPRKSDLQFHLKHNTRTFANFVMAWYVLCCSLLRDVRPTTWLTGGRRHAAQGRMEQQS